MTIKSSYVCGIVQAFARFKLAAPLALHPVAKGSTLLGGTSPAPKVSPPAITPASIAANFNTQEQAKTQQVPELKLAAILKAAGIAKRQTTFQNHTLKIEWDKGDTRKGVAKDTGKAWERTMYCAYGYIPKTKGVDGEAIDIYLAADPDKDAPVFIVHQVNKSGKHDEDKVMLGFTTEAAAKAMYLKHVPAWCFGHVRRLSPKAFDMYLQDASTKQAAAALCTSCRKDRHYGPCAKAESFQLDDDAAAKMHRRLMRMRERRQDLYPKEANFNAGLYGEGDTQGDAPSMSPHYTSGTTSDSGPARARPGKPEDQVRSTFQDFLRPSFANQMADQSSSAYGGLVKTCSGVNWGPYEKRGPTGDMYQQIQRPAPPVAQGYVGPQAVDHAFGQIDCAVDSTNIENAGGTSGGPAVLG